MNTRAILEGTIPEHPEQGQVKKVNFPKSGINPITSASSEREAMEVVN